MSVRNQPKIHEANRPPPFILLHKLHRHILTPLPTSLLYISFILMKPTLKPIPPPIPKPIRPPAHPFLRPSLNPKARGFIKPLVLTLTPSKSLRQKHGVVCICARSSHPLIRAPSRRTRSSALPERWFPVVDFFPFLGSQRDCTALLVISQKFGKTVLRRLIYLVF